MFNLEKEYDPTQWSTRITDPKELLAKHVEFGNQVSDSNRYAINCLLNFSYGDSFRQRLDIYGMNLPKDAPIIVYVHSGYWQGMNKHTSAYAVKPFVDHAKVFVIDHDLCPDVSLATVIEQFQLAVTRIFNYASEHKVKNIHFIGHQSGAHLITYLFCDEMISRLGSDKFELIKHVYLISGVYDVSELRKTKNVNCDNLLSITDENVDKLSPIKQKFDQLKRFKAIKFDAFVGSDESPTLTRQTREFVALLKQTKIAANFHLMDGHDHFSIVENLSKVDYEITKMIVKNL